MTESEKALLKDITILRLLPTETQTKLLNRFTKKHFKFGEIIVREGEPADIFYLLTYGKARVLTTTNDGSEIPLNTLHVGDCFGEMGLLSSGKRTKTVRASGDVTAMSLSGKDFNEIISQNSEVREYIKILIKYRNLENFLREFTSLGKIPSEVLGSMLQHLELLNFKAGDIIIEAGSAPGPMYIIEKGRCRVIRNQNGHDQKIAYLRQGEFFGELSLLQNSHRAATVEALSDCDLLALSPHVFKNILHRYPLLHGAVKKRIAHYSSGRESDRVPLDFTQIIENSQVNQAQGGKDSDIFKNTSFPTLIESKGAEVRLDKTTKATKHRKAKRRHRFTLIRQIDESDCGAAALGMICHYFCVKLTLAQVRELSNTSIDGTTLQDLCNASHEIGLNACAAKLSKRNLDTIPTPAIIHWQDNHWVVLIKHRKDSFQIADPADKIFWIERNKFEQNWSGYALIFDDVNSNISIPETQGFIHRISPHFKSFTWPTTITFLISFIICALQLLFPVLTQIIVDDVIIVRDPENLNVFVTALGVGLVMTLLLTILQQYSLSSIAIRLDRVVSDVVVNKLLALPMAYFNKRSPDDVQRRLEGARDIKHFVVYRVIGGIIAFVQLLTFVGLMAFYNIKMMLIFFILIPIYLGLMYFSAKVLKPAFDDLQITESQYRTLQTDIVKGIQVVKAAGFEALFKRRILKEYSNLARTQGQSNFNIFCYEGTIHALGFLATIIFIWVGARLVLMNELTMGRFIAFQMLIAMSYSPILTLLSMWQELQRSSVLINRLNDIIVSTPEQPQCEETTLVTTLQGLVEFKNVSLAYGGLGSPKVLNGISFSTIPGQLVAIVGKSGAGKSSLVKCIAGLLKQTEGEILYDGISLSSLNLSSLRQFIGVASQNEYLFSGTVIENISLGDPNPDIDKVFRAANAANAHKFILELPNDYKTIINDTELLLSQGQKQSIAIARMLYRDTPILILDEATSAMDLESEGVVLSNLEKLRFGRLLFLVTHRLETTKNADIIFVMEKGYIVEQGNHDDLMARRGLYYQLFTTQYA